MKSHTLARKLLKWPNLHVVTRLNGPGVWEVRFPMMCAVEFVPVRGRRSNNPAQNKRVLKRSVALV